MNKLMENKPILHAVLWIVIYIAAVNVGDAISEAAGVANLATVALLLALTVAVVLYLKKSNRLETYGIKKVTRQDARKTLWYVPLMLLALVQFVAGIDRALSATEIIISCLLMVSVGFIEELVFRGFLFHAIHKKSGVNRAIVISGVTFGVGHIVNLLRGYAAAELVGQIVVAIAVGLVLAWLVAITKNIVPGILFHVVFNIGGTITNAARDTQTYLLITILVVSVLYAVYLSKLAQGKTKPAQA